MTKEMREKLKALVPQDMIDWIAQHKQDGVKNNIANYVAKHNPELVEAAEKDLNETVKAQIVNEMKKYIESLTH